MTTIVETYSFIEFEGEQPQHNKTETIVGDAALIDRILSVDTENNMRFLAKDSAGRRVYFRGGELESA